MPPPTIRPFRTEDTATVVEIANLAWERIHDSHRAIFGAELYAVLFPEDRERKGNEMRRHCAHTPDRIWICELHERPVGFIMWSMDVTKRIGTVGNNGLHPDVDGQGLGTFMYRSLLEHFRAKGMRHAKVHTGLDEGHAPARRAYERMGFNIRHEAVDYYMEL
jgi:ribosomal protein S18 acetylase RimI-like enzyme